MASHDAPIQQSHPAPSVPSVGLLYPGYGAEDDFPALEHHLGRAIRLPLVHTSVGIDHHEIQALLDLGSPERLAAGAHELMKSHPAAAMWACTSGSFVFGWDGAHDQVAGLAEILGVPTSSTSIAFINALQHLDIDHVAVAASYPLPVAERFVEFLDRGGIAVTTMASHDIETAAGVGELTDSEVIALARSVDTAGAGAVLVPDTAMHSLLLIDQMEAAVGIPVLTANQVTVWEGLRLQSALSPYRGVGTLFT